MSPNRGARAARGVLVALFATFIALMSHIAAGGQPPGWLGIVAPLSLAATVSTVLAGRQLSLWRLMVSVVLSQLLFHSLFTLGAPNASHLFRAHEHHPGRITTASALGAVADHAHGGSFMWVAHAFAAAVTVAGIYIGERSTAVATVAVAAAQAWLSRTVTVAVAGLVLAFERPLGAIVRDVRVLRSLCVLTTHRRRGPPATSGI